MTASTLGPARPEMLKASLENPDAGASGFRLAPVRLAIAAWLLALVPMGLLQLTHADLHEHNELPPLLHWVRDASLAVPFAAIAIVVAAVAVAWARPHGATARGSLASPALWALLAAVAFAILSIPGNELHAALFGAEEEVGVGLFEDLTTDAILALQGSLVVLVPLAILLGVPWQGRLRDPRPTRGTPPGGDPR